MQWLTHTRRVAHSRVIVAAVLSAAFVSTGAFAKEKIEENPETPYLARDFIFVESPAIEEYLRAVCQRMLDASGVKMELPRILVQSSDAFNAFSDANSNLIISTGALRAMESEDELAALLGHELAHLVLKHPQDKDAMRSLPLGIQSTASFKDAAAELKGQKATHVSDLSKFDPNNMNEAQATSVLWSDFVSPSWNRGQEREADQQGFELMRAAGYDPSAFGQLFSKLGAAEAKRSERMQVLKKALVIQLREAGKHAAPRASGAKGEALALTSDVKNSAVDSGSEKLVDGLSAFNRSYESPDERQAALSAYAREHRQAKRPPRPEVKFAQVLRGGAGAELLKVDAAALGTMDALAARNAAEAKKAAEGLGAEDAKPASSHLHLARVPITRSTATRISVLARLRHGSNLPGHLRRLTHGSRRTRRRGATSPPRSRRSNPAGSGWGAPDPSCLRSSRWRAREATCPLRGTTRGNARRSRTGRWVRR